jgi:CheY-like chemotaxis protein
MPRVLVVEDSADQARFITALLEKDGFTVDLTANGVEALAAIGRHLPDVILTDLRMPEMNGLELVEAVTSKHPSLPVVLMTAFGSEEVAVTALRRGAASYIPKDLLEGELIDTLTGVVAITESKLQQQRVLEHMTSMTLTFELPNDDSVIPGLVTYLEQDLKTRYGSAHESDALHVGVSLNEALINAMHHGNLELSSEIRETDHRQFYELVKQRRTEPPYRGRRVNVRVRMSPTQVVYVVRDEGPGFDPDALPDPTDPSNVLKVSGRGLYLISTFMDEVSHNDQGNEITMVKRFARSRRPARSGAKQAAG